MFEGRTLITNFGIPAGPTYDTSEVAGDFTPSSWVLVGSGSEGWFHPVKAKVSWTVLTTDAKLKGILQKLKKFRSKWIYSKSYDLFDYRSNIFC